MSAVRSSSSDLLLPWTTRRSAGTPADEGDVQLAAGGDVEQQALLVGEAGHGQAQEGLRGVDDVAVAEDVDGLAAAGPQVVLVVDEQRRAVLGGQLGDVDAGDEQLPLGPDGGVVGEEAGRDAAHAGLTRFAPWLPRVALGQARLPAGLTSAPAPRCRAGRGPAPSTRAVRSPARAGCGAPRLLGPQHRAGLVERP